MPLPPPVTVAFDADDTLWHNETLFHDAQQQLTTILSRYHDAKWILKHLYDTETRNIEHFGYGVKGFTLSMIETAIELSEGRISGTEIQQIIDLGTDMLRAPVEVLPHVRETIKQLQGHYRLMVITKGDLFDQESKVARSGLGELFEHVDVVSEKNPDVYRAILKRRGIASSSFVMIGNSLRSDILPIVEIGGTAIHIPYHITWEREQVEATPNSHGYFQLSSIKDVPQWLREQFA